MEPKRVKTGSEGAKCLVVRTVSLKPVLLSGKRCKKETSKLLPAAKIEARKRASTPILRSSFFQ